MTDNMTENIDYGQLVDYATNEIIRDATADEWDRSAHASNDEGVIEVDGRSVYVQGGPDA